MAGDAKGEYRGTGYRNDAELKAWLAKRPSETALDPDFPIAHHTIVAGIDRGASGLN